MRVCDWCTKKLEGAAVRCQFSYPSQLLDGEPDVEFCSDRCAVAWLGKHLAKPWGENLEKMEKEIAERKKFEDMDRCFNSEKK